MNIPAINKTFNLQNLDEASIKISEYLQVGGFWNPEMMEHDKVRDLLMEIRNLLDNDYVFMKNELQYLTVKDEANRRTLQAVLAKY